MNGNSEYKKQPEIIAISGCLSDLAALFRQNDMDLGASQVEARFFGRITEKQVNSVGDGCSSENAMNFQLLPVILNTYLPN